MQSAYRHLTTLSLHDALPIFGEPQARRLVVPVGTLDLLPGDAGLDRSRPACRWREQDQLGTRADQPGRSEEHTSELQSPCNLVCRLLLEMKSARLSG